MANWQPGTEFAPASRDGAMVKADNHPVVKGRRFCWRTAAKEAAAEARTAKGVTKMSLAAVIECNTQTSGSNVMRTSDNYTEPRPIWKPGMDFVPGALQESAQELPTAPSWKSDIELLPHPQRESQWPDSTSARLPSQGCLVWVQPDGHQVDVRHSNFSPRTPNLQGRAANRDGAMVKADDHSDVEGRRFCWRAAAKEAAAESRKVMGVTKLSLAAVIQRDMTMTGSKVMRTCQSDDGNDTTDSEMSFTQSKDIHSTDDGSDQSSLTDEVSDVDSGADFGNEVRNQVAVAEATPVHSGTFSRAFLLTSRCVFRNEICPPALLTFKAQRHESTRMPGKAVPFWCQPRQSSLDTSDQRQRPNCKTPSKQPTLLPQSETAYRVFVANAREPMSQEKQLQREVNSLLNKVCPNNLDTIVQRVAETEVHSVGDLELVIGLLFKKALAEPHYCETYTDMVAALQQRIPEFPSHSGRATVTFKAALLSATQSEFESLSDVLTLRAEEVKDLDVDEIKSLEKKRKDRVLANMKFIGHLFLRGLLSVRVISSILLELARCNDEAHVEEPMVECLCELLVNIGFALEATPIGKAALISVTGRLQDLKGRPTPNGCSSSCYSRRIQFAIQDIIDMRARGWTQRSFKASAKTKAEIRREHERDSKVQACGRSVSGASDRSSYRNH